MSLPRALTLMLAAIALAPVEGGAAATTPAAGASSMSATPAAKPVLPWIDDDYSKALAQARARKLPIFIESWAPW